MMDDACLIAKSMSVTGINIRIPILILFYDITVLYYKEKL